MKFILLTAGLVIPKLAFSFPLAVNAYNDESIGSLKEQLLHRIAVEPFNLVATIIFACAIVHTFMASKIHHIAVNMQHRHLAKIRNLKKEGILDPDVPGYHFLSSTLLYLGEMEIVLALWALILGGAFAIFKDWATFLNYLQENVSFTESLFVIVIMTLAATKPITYAAGKIISIIAKNLKWLFRTHTGSLWFVTLTLGPLLGSLITEVAAVTICSLLLIETFFKYTNSNLAKYLTLGILLANISIGGVLTNYAAPVILVVVKPWDISNIYMLKTFGPPALFSVFTNVVIGFFILRKEFKIIEKTRADTEPDNQKKSVVVPWWVIAVHIFFMVLIVSHAHTAIIFIGAYLLAIGFITATSPYQSFLDLRGPLLIGLFISGLLIHGGLQGWWIAPLLAKFDNSVIFWISALLSSFNDNASISYISSLTPNIAEATKYSILAGAVAVGGLTILANAPNPTAFSLLKEYFSKGISHVLFFLGALIPTLITLFYSFYIFRPN